MYIKKAMIYIDCKNSDYGNGEYLVMGI
jgi:hypothetical protein